jgi:hypothetical protein
MFKCVNNEHECGVIWQDADDNVSVFEDRQGVDGLPIPVYYAWEGSPEDHDQAKHTACHTTFWGAVEALDRAECGAEYEAAPLVYD